MRLINYKIYSMAIVYLSLGSNKGDRVGYVQQATSLLSAISDETNNFVQAKNSIQHSEIANNLTGAKETVNNSNKVLKIIRTSSLYETQPWLEKNTTWFVNAVIEIKTNLSPADLLAECLRIEKQLGRNRKLEGHFGDRTIDIDILFYDKEIIKNEKLQIPHKYLHQRAFILVPLLEINPDFIHPELNKSIAQLHEELENPEMVYLYGTRIDGI